MKNIDSNSQVQTTNNKDNDYNITIIIYFNSTFDEKTFFKCTFFIVFLGLSELFYIIFSFVMFYYKDIIILYYYMQIVIFSGFLIFVSSLINFTDEDEDQYFTTTCKVIVLLGSSLIMLLSLIYLIWACKLTKHVEIIFI